MILPMVLQDSLILPKGPARLIDLAKGSHQMFGGILPFVDRIRFVFSASGLLMGPRWISGASVPFRYPWLMSLAPTNGAIRCQGALK